MRHQESHLAQCPYLHLEDQLVSPTAVKYVLGPQIVCLKVLTPGSRPVVIELQRVGPSPGDVSLLVLMERPVIRIVDDTPPQSVAV